MWSVFFHRQISPRSQSAGAATLAIRPSLDQRTHSYQTSPLYDRWTSSAGAAKLASERESDACRTSSDTPDHGILEESLQNATNLPRAFDVRECRDWLILELGEVEQLPSILHYSTGIQEVRDRLLKRYGPGSLNVAMNIVHDLIENKRNVTGFGLDDGDRFAPCYRAGTSGSVLRCTACHLIKFVPRELTEPNRRHKHYREEKGIADCGDAVFASFSRDAEGYDDGWLTAFAPHSSFVSASAHGDASFDNDSPPDFITSALCNDVDRPFPCEAAEAPTVPRAPAASGSMESAKWFHKIAKPVGARASKSRVAPGIREPSEV